MSYVVRRGLSTLIPPKVASPQGIGQAKDAARMERLKSFYEKLPKGPAPASKPTGLIGRYKYRYFDGPDASAAPIWHLIAFFTVIGYAQNYYFHLRHHKNNAH